jgi:nucleoside 2-deoxyribosyltransferase
MRIYLASRYSRYPEMQRYRDDLRTLGHVVTARWLEGAHQALDDELESEAAARFAQEDCEDLASAECVISFTEPPRTGATRGGRHVEHGMALALKKRTIVVGFRENVFHSLPVVEFFECWEEALHALKQVWR